jgi:hypothetical protein
VATTTKSKRNPVAKSIPQVPPDANHKQMHLDHSISQSIRNQAREMRGDECAQRKKLSR